MVMWTVSLRRFSRQRGAVRPIAPLMRTMAAWALSCGLATAATPGDGFVLGAIGSLTADAGEVINGQRSIKGSQTGTDRSQTFLRTDPSTLPLQRGGRYRIRFNHRVLVTPDRGFEVLFLSNTAAAQGQFLPSLVVAGDAERSGSATLDGQLGPYDDYHVRFNVIGRGAIVVDDIEITDLGSGKVVALADAEAQSAAARLAQARLPPGQVGRPYAVTLSAVGGQPPYRWDTGTASLPAGLRLDEDGHLWGQPLAAGSQVVQVQVVDAAGRRTTMSRPLQVTAASPMPAAPALVVDADGMATVRPARYAQAFRNPLGGLRPYLENVTAHPWASLGRQYVPWNRIEAFEADSVDSIRIFSDLTFADLPSLNIKAVPRVFLHWPPDRHFWPADLPAGDYLSPAFRARMQRLIGRLGQAWNDDPRVAFVETGLIGYWGEQHHPGFASLGATPSLPAAMEAEFGDAYVAAFPDKPLMNRYPVNLTAYPFGIHWDVFGSFDRGYFGNDTTTMTQALESGVHAERWKTAPRGGEVDPTFLGAPDWSEASQRSVVRTQTPRLLSIIRRLHWNHLAVLEGVDRSDATLTDQLGQLHSALGYRFELEQARYSATVQPGGALTVQLQLRNTGSSPLYANWPVEVALHDGSTRRRVWSALWEGLDLRAWLPDQPVTVQRQFALPSTLPAPAAGSPWVLSLAILDPSGMRPAVRLAAQAYWMGGRTPIGPVAVNGSPPRQALSVFDDLASDESLYYLSATDAKAEGAAARPPVRGEHDCLFDWAERTYPNFLPVTAPRPPGVSPTLTFMPYHYRHYPAASTYVGISSADDRVYYLGPLSNGELLDLGPRLDLVTLAGCR